MKLRKMVVVTLLVLGCSFACAQSYTLRFCGHERRPILRL